MPRTDRGYVLIMLSIAVLALSIGLMVAVPVWQTLVQREKEEELIFRGKQYVEAIRLYQTKFPGRFPDSLEALSKENCLRREFGREWLACLRRSLARTTA